MYWTRDGVRHPQPRKTPVLMTMCGGDIVFAPAAVLDETDEQMLFVRHPEGNYLGFAADSKFSDLRNGRSVAAAPLIRAAFEAPGRRVTVFETASTNSNAVTRHPATLPA